LTPSSTTDVPDFFEERDGPRDECGVFGIYAPELDVARLTYFALYALQHRGQESAGIASSDGSHIITLRDTGLVSQVFDEEKLRGLTGNMSVGHVRYSTTGSSGWENTQPIYRADHHMIALAHNGNLINAVELHSELREQGITFRSTSDSEIIAALVSNSTAETIADAVAEIMPRLRGAFSTVICNKEMVVAFRDPNGLRPLALGQIGDRYCFASESSAFDIIGAKFLREVEPGEMIALTEGGMEVTMVVPGERKAFCVFEHIYFARPDSHLEGQLVQQSRGRMGEILWREAPVEADMVVAVPDSGNPAAKGLSRASGIPMDDGLIKNRYVGRTFIQPGQELRKLGLRMKFTPLPEIVSGQRLIIVDDSIVRGNTTRQIIGMLREAGAKEIHVRISAPPIRHSCHYGIDMSTNENMIAYGKEVDEIAKELGADSLAYISLDGVYEAIRGERGEHCDACFTGEYPLADTDRATGKFALEEISPLPQVTGNGNGNGAHVPVAALEPAPVKS
jgi:amidophosphoribosyltransferase